MHPYYYIRNGQGDVIGLFDANGNVVARYSYDSWGNLLSIKDGSGNDKTNDTTFVGYKNPLRYRGYYYDSETKLYYLQSRYYNPEWGRFINADSSVDTEQGLAGTNMFAYCGNNPIIFVDSSGKIFGLAAAFTATVFVVTAVAVVSICAVVFSNPTVQQGIMDMGSAIGTAIEDTIGYIGDTINYYREHDSNKTKSNKNTHEKGQKRKQMDDRGEKGDKRRTPNPNKRRPSNSYILANNPNCNHVFSSSRYDASLPTSMMVSNCTICGLVKYSHV